MLRESFAMLLVGVLLLGTCLRSKHYGYALAVVPVTGIPFLHLLVAGVLYLSQGAFFGVRPAIVMAFGDLMGAIISCVFVMIFSQNFQSKTSRWVYRLVMLLYILIIGWVYIFQSLSALL